MASGRFISSTLGDSEKFSSLTDPRYQVAFVLIVTWADAEGRFIADPITLNGKLFTRLGWTPDLVRSALDELDQAGLVTLYQVDGKPYGVVEKFHQHNTITRKADGSPAREAASKLPPPPELPRSAAAPPRQPPQSSSEPTEERLHSDRAAVTPEVEVQVQVQGEVEENPSSPQHTRASSADVEAPPRRDVDSPSGEIQRRRGRDATAVRPADQPYVDAWNEHRGPLPRILTVGKERERALDRLRHELGADALEVFTDAVKQVAREPSYREKGYGFGNLLAGGDAKVLKWAEKWRSSGGLSDSDRRLADKAKTVAEAIGGI